MYKIKIKIKYYKGIRYLTVIMVVMVIMVIMVVIVNRNMIKMILNMQYNKLINMDITIIIIRHSNIKIMNNNKYKKYKFVQILKKDITNLYNS